MKGTGQRPVYYVPLSIEQTLKVTESVSGKFEENARRALREGQRVAPAQWDAFDL